MEELTEQAKQMLEALKAEETPSKASSDRMWAAVAGGAAAGAIAGLSKGKLLLLGALGVTGVVAMILVASPGEPDDGDTARGAAGGEAPVVAVDQPEPEPEPEPKPEPSAVPEAPAPAPSEVEVAPEGPETEPVSKRPKTSPEPEAKAEAEGGDSDDLERELSLLARAKRALRGKDAAGALRSLDAHRKEFPRSTFGEERDLLRMTALCELGKREQARREADEFLKRNPSSALTAQVRRVCPAESEGE